MSNPPHPLTVSILALACPGLGWVGLGSSLAGQPRAEMAVGDISCDTYPSKSYVNLLQGCGHPSTKNTGGGSLNICPGSSRKSVTGPPEHSHRTLSVAISPQGTTETVATPPSLPPFHGAHHCIGDWRVMSSPRKVDKYTCLASDRGHPPCPAQDFVYHHPSNSAVDSSPLWSHSRPGPPA